MSSPLLRLNRDLSETENDPKESNAKIREVAADIASIVNLNKLSIVAIDGPPGSGKTTLSRFVQSALENSDRDVGMVTTDMDVLPRKQRGKKSILEYHPGEIVQEAVRMHERRGGQIETMVYETSTGDHTHHARIEVPNEDGILIVEGLEAIEHVLAVRGDLKGVLSVIITTSENLVEQRRLNRDTSTKGLSTEEINQRIRSQRLDLRSLYADLTLHLLRNRYRRRTDDIKVKI